MDDRTLKQVQQAILAGHGSYAEVMRLSELYKQGWRQGFACGFVCSGIICALIIFLVIVITLA